jgi:hypothetical protein
MRGLMGVCAGLGAVCWAAGFNTLVIAFDAAVIVFWTIGRTFLISTTKVPDQNSFPSR